MLRPLLRMLRSCHVARGKGYGRAFSVLMREILRPRHPQFLGVAIDTRGFVGSVRTALCSFEEGGQESPYPVMGFRSGLTAG